MKPFIGVNLDVREGAPEQLVLNAAYSQAIQASGGIPLLIAPMSDADLDEILTLVSGVVFTGGKDYQPELYGSSAQSTVDLAHPWRQDFDLRLMRKCLQETQLPVLGICAGHQMLNIALGGTLIQDLGSELDSETAATHLGCDPNSKINHHTIDFDQSTHLYDMFRSKQIRVPSAHHQAIAKLGRGLRASSRADDGVIESIELPGRRLTLGVQWHPERDYKGNSPLFQTFVAAAMAS